MQMTETIVKNEIYLKKIFYQLEHSNQNGCEKYDQWLE